MKSNEHHSIPQRLADEYDDVASLVADVAQEVYVRADAVGTVAVVAYAVGLTGCVQVEALCVDGCGGAACTGYGSLNGGCHLVHSDDMYHLLRSPGDGGDAVAVTIDVADDTAARRRALRNSHTRLQASAQPPVAHGMGRRQRRRRALFRQSRESDGKADL